MKLKRLSLVMVLALGFLTFGTLFLTTSAAFPGLEQEALPTAVPTPAFPDAKKIVSSEPADLPVPGGPSPNHLTHPCAGLAPEPIFMGISPLSIATAPGTELCTNGYGDIAVWQNGTNEYVAMSGFARRMFHIWDVNDPYNPAHLITVPFPTGGTASTSAFTFKQGSNYYLSITMRGSGTGCGYFIYNVNDPANPTLVTRFVGTDWCSMHEHFVSTDANGDADYAWIAGGGEGGFEKVVALNLSDINNITETGRYERPDRVSYIHDVTVIGNRVYSAHWSGGLIIHDKMTLATQTDPLPLNPIDSIRPTDNSYRVHQAWPTSDGNHVFIQDEFIVGATVEKVRLYNISNISAPFYETGIVGEGQAATTSAHNMKIQNISAGLDRLYVGWYRAGTRGFEVNTTVSPPTIVQTIKHELRLTAGGAGGGAWGVDYLPCTLDLGGGSHLTTCIYTADYEKFGLVSDALDYEPTLDPYDPESTVTSPVSGQEITTCTFTITGTAHDYYSGVAGIEVSTDNGSTWQAAQGTTNWTYEWTIPADGSYTIQARATDVAGNVQTVMTPVNVTATGGCTVFTPTPGNTNTATTVPTATVTNTPVPTTCPIQFSDVPVTHTFYANIRCLACQGIVSGYSDGTFRPNNQVTRGQLAKMVSNSAGFSEPVSGQTFEDVPPTNTFYDWIERLSTRGHMSGYACTPGPGPEPCISGRPYFRPFANATRGQTAKIVSNAAGYTEPPVGETFEDVKTTHTFYEFIQRLASRNVMQGYACGGAGEPCVPPDNKPYFRPQNDVTRGQSAKIVANTFFANCNTP